MLHDSASNCTAQRTAHSLSLWRKSSYRSLFCATDIFWVFLLRICSARQLNDPQWHPLCDWHRLSWYASITNTWVFPSTVKMFLCVFPIRHVWNDSRILMDVAPANPLITMSQIFVSSVPSDLCTICWQLLLLLSQLCWVGVRGWLFPCRDSDALTTLVCHQVWG